MSRLIGNIKINILLRYVTVMYNFAVGVILARLLTPEDFGLVAIVYVFYNILATIGDMGLGASIVQFKELQRKDIISLFVFTIIIGLLISTVMFFSSYLISIYYQIEELLYIVKAFSLSIFFYVVNNIPSSLNRRDKKFKSIGIIEFISFFISGLVAVVIAYVLDSYYALVIQLLLYNVLVLLGNITLLNNSKTTFEFSEIRNISLGSSINKVYVLSRNSALFDITNFFNRNMDNFIIGKFFGSSFLGYYDRAYKLFLFPIHNITKLLNPILHPVLVDYKDDKDFIYNKFLLLTRFLGLIGFPLSVFMFFSSSEIIVFLYGENWMFAGEIMKVLSIGIGFQMISTSGSVFYYTSNNSKLNLYGGLISLSLNLIVVVIAVYLNSFTVVLYGLVVSFIVSFVYVIYTINVIIYKRGITMFFNSIKNIVVVSVLMILAFFYLIPYYPNNLLFNIIVAIFSFLIGIFITREYRWIISNVKNILNGN